MRLKGRSVLITGGAGFLGSHLCEKALAEGAKVRVLDIDASGRKANLSAVMGEIELVDADVACEGKVLRAAEDVDTIVHLAFPMTLRRQSVETRAAADILTGLLNLIRAALERDALFIYISSIAVYGDAKYVPMDENHPLEPVLLHGAVKLAGENFCRTLVRSSGLRAVTLRVADIYGPRNSRLSVPIKFLLQAMQDEPITVYGDGSDSRTYTYVSDFSEAVVLSMIRPEAVGETFNVGGDECVSMLQLAGEVRKVTAKNSPVVFQGFPAAAGRILFVDNKKSKRLLGFEPVFNIGEGLRITYRWLKENPGYYRP
ncbi:MAG TPA: NAD-dependent epimerase/dehydratase family protein [Bacillota bacterium]|nr:NAD-dependent epimerase/dehydratase family protein [Bacillota bacterium]